MHARLSSITPEQFSADRMVIYSTHEIQPPAQFQDNWRTLGEHCSRRELEDKEATWTTDAEADTCLIFADTNDKEHMQRARRIAEGIRIGEKTGVVAPHVMLVPHSVAPEFRQESAADCEEAILCWEVEHDTFHDVIIGQPCGFRLACEVQSRITQQLRLATSFNEKANARYKKLQKAEDLEENIDSVVWDYLRIRLDTQLPRVDYNISPGRPETIHGYLVGEELGAGNFGTVCSLVDPTHHIVQAVKMVDKKPLTSFNGIRSVQRQLHVLRLLTSDSFKHKNVIRVYECYHTPTHLLFRMEHGGRLALFQRLGMRDRAEHDVHLGIEKVTSLLLQCMAALCHLHLGPHVVHRDIKPENFIVTETNEGITAKLADFETAVVMPKGGRCLGVIGTLPFVAPEVVRADLYDPFAADVWSMGMVFLEICCCLSIVKKTIGWPSLTPENNATRTEDTATATEKIHTFFARTSHISELLDTNLRPELRRLRVDAQILGEGMLDTWVDRRWRAGELASQELFMLA